MSTQWKKKGLPTRHFSYVQNIDPGLPLFLFNYSDRKLHGIFEASSKGKMYMDPYAWIDDDFSDKTQYPAQVKVRVRIQCHPLSEDKFGHAIAKNYYSDNHFRFELDHRQTSNLMYLLASMAIAPDGDIKQLYNRPIKKQIDEDDKNLIYKKLLKLARDKECGELSLLHHAHNVDDAPYIEMPTYLEQMGASSCASIENQYTVFQFGQGVEELGAFKQAQLQENFYLEEKLMKTSLEIQHVKHHCTIFECTNVEQTTMQSTIELHLNSKRSSLSKGSFEGATTNGFECLTNVEMLDLDRGRWMSTHSILDKVKHISY
uniref:Uncharacterized protein LOC113787016 n=1 Tax=Cicer arietinum TaxID=3827 RepID=A0A3Q7YC54_CICAR|nr:uncharacterized protein LOC113787016 [Cicer arietinum]